MAAQRLANYLKTYRKRSGLTQRELAFLVGSKRGEQFSRYESHHRTPTLQVALACEVVFKVPVSDLFKGMHKPIAKQISARVETLATELQRKHGQGKGARLTAKKLSWLADFRGRVPKLPAPELEPGSSAGSATPDSPSWFR